ncbi:MAG: type III-B CRISPR-associated protein Cas10/Cmr2 [Gomphosphaeria aponina SAG 52.96 = DSM 107014]|uniref:Type III-B CRISPR-associated protein Cas10/Cmr2 n=1 Tax=Gomphosphaeria aponina SAG 52.96 = DSM 107014 TaxID=1521640 RepID=A0A941GTW7_9CHRO|nr:type III-B CRISPR-associated protein Cas10/Cmr2 [Gomphosphaeria aponina SAG 52.96 = DSM 107014]
MSQTYWIAKIKGLLQPFNLDEIERYLNDEIREISSWQDIQEILTHPSVNSEIISLAEQIANASDRTVLKFLENNIENQEKLTVSHLLSGKNFDLSLTGSIYQNLLRQTNNYANNSERSLDSFEIQDLKKIHWWLWRCLPEIICQKLGNQDNFLLPASLILPDASIWSHASLVSAIAGTLTGYNNHNSQPQIPYLATFSFSPIQEMIKASRKMRDFWAGSWVLHYLSAKTCWQLANIYGADCFIYPSLFQQPLIDHWLLQKNWDDFSTKEIQQPTDKAILTAGFPNVIVMLLPQDKLQSAMQTAREIVINEWLVLGTKVFQELENRHWTRELRQEHPTWNQWLKYQWQTYWTALPLNDTKDPLYWSITNNSDEFQQWQEHLNHICQLNEGHKLFTAEEQQFIQAVAQNKPNLTVNISSWWGYLFDQLRLSLGTVKNSRNWRIPTSFYPRSTISGLGSVVYPQPNNNKEKVTEGDTRQYWQNQGGLFDGNEQLNSTEVLKRGLHLVLPELLFNDSGKKIPYCYPDLSSGVAGWLKCYPEMESVYIQACSEITQTFQWTKKASKISWGIPWIDENKEKENWLNPRLVNVGWLIEDFTLDNGENLQVKKEEEKKLRNCINQYFNEGNNPTDWYVIATGDGDGMSKWLKGEKLGQYKDYIPNNTVSEDLVIQDSFNNLIEIQKRMGPSTHNYLSRALLDFSNRLVPYLTEERYAGRLIYSGGDDVLAYSNLWEWDNWLWDIRRCFRGEEDPCGEFNDTGNYWQLKKDESRPLFTMGQKATVSFGVVIAHHSVPLGIALENLWEAEKKAKDYDYQNKKKDAVQVRVLFGNGNKIQATAPFDVFSQWKELIELKLNKPLAPSLFEIASQIWEQHPAPYPSAIEPWTRAFCDRREGLNGEDKNRFQNKLQETLTAIFNHTPPPVEKEIKNWLKLAAFVLRNRNIKPKKGGNDE